MRSCGAAVLIYTLLATLTAAGDLVGAAPAPTTSARESRQMHKLWVAIYLNATACSAAASIPQSFLVAFEKDLRERLLRHMPLLRGAASANHSSTGSVSCAAPCFPSRGAAAVDAPRGRGAACSHYPPALFLQVGG
ncbi:uncharacterized protein Tco025E_01382 [Trypanosoma conorhini]|uniref:Receptor-type adenylate cyclase n=1 Tax=Trypanosoma conorhini TaxID=83891 RepID=A0A3R7PJI5_9TRYP|nr:uncharacterized protein Tco025E_01382 [Trypanosoma conorhini]RNF26259.1 hypothetical protein Tco025E_01382 [Trypanosoma conorhini]